MLSEGSDIQVRGMFEILSNTLTHRHYGRKLVSIEQQSSRMITACFGGGFKSGGLSLVGSDGSGSQVREILVGAARASPIDTGINLLKVPYS
jgi:hypothetical protein